MKLRPYQQQGIDSVRKALAKQRAVLRQLPTGGGKTAEFTKITELSNNKGNSVWIVASQNELVGQASDHLHRLGVNHCKITANSQESLAYSVHVCSRQALMNRLKSGKIKRMPDLVIIDEAHLALDSQLKLADYLPPTCKIIGVTATPERLDGRGLSELYGELILGPAIRYMVENGFLTDAKYFGIPIEGVRDLHKKNGDYDKHEVEDLLSKKMIYGSCVSHYREKAHNKPCLVYCVSVKSAEETALKFQDAGYKFLNIDGGMSYAQQKEIINKLRTGEIHGITSCELITYGLDVPRVECIIMLRPTLSRTLYYQMLGRGLRPYSDPETRYMKQYCVILDHVGNREEFCVEYDKKGQVLKEWHPFDFTDWDFYGKNKRKRSTGKLPPSPKQCQKCFMYFDGAVCPHCGEEREAKPRVPIEEVDGVLVEYLGPIKMKDRPPENRRIIDAEIQAALTQYWEGSKTGEAVPEAVTKLLSLAEETGRKPMWVYWRISEGLKVVNMPLIHEIARQKEYSPGWTRRTIEMIENKLRG